MRMGVRVRGAQNITVEPPSTVISGTRVRGRPGKKGHHRAIPTLSRLGTPLAALENVMSMVIGRSRGSAAWTRYRGSHWTRWKL